MRSLRTTILGIVISMVVGIMSVVIAYAGLSLSGERNIVLPGAIVISSMAGSTTAGAICVALRYLVTKREKAILAPMVTVAVAALVVLPGDYVNGSLVPPAMYGMALLNGLIVAQVINPLYKADFGLHSRHLS